MNVAAFAVVIGRERVSEHGDSIESLRDLGRASPVLAWTMTIAMLSLAGFPATVGFIGKFYLIDAVGGRRLRLARDRDRGRLDDLARLLPARDRGDVDGPVRDRAAHHPAAPRAAGVRLVARGRRPGAARGRARRRCWRRRPRCSSGSSRRRCSTWRATWARRCRACSSSAPGRGSSAGPSTRGAPPARAAPDRDDAPTRRCPTRRSPRCRRNGSARWTST